MGCRDASSRAYPGTMNAGKLRVVDDVSPADWIAPRLSGRFGAVGLTIPRGFSAYARIFHPAESSPGDATRWATVASATGREAHALMQWDSIVAPTDRNGAIAGSWNGVGPSRGDLDHVALRALCRRLAVGQRDEPECFFCLWEGYGELASYGWLRRPAAPGSRVAPEQRHLFTASQLESARLSLPRRTYVVLSGSLLHALLIGSFACGTFWPKSPNLFWPVDHAWCVATEIDFDSTLVGGSDTLIAAIVDDPALEAWPIGPDASLASDADEVNRVAPGTPGSRCQGE